MYVVGPLLALFATMKAMPMRTPLVASLIAATAFATPAVAQERFLNFSLGGGVVAAPSFPGSGDFDVEPDLGFKFGALQWGGIRAGNGIGELPANGFGVRGAFRVLGDRDADDNPELAGLTERDTAVELGLGLVYQQTNWMAFGEVRKGVTGHSAWTGDVGADYIYRPTDRLTLTAGPRVSFGESEFAQDYFGVTQAEADASGFDAFDADGGALGAGFAIGAEYELSPNWSLDGELGYERLINDAGDSPITAIGDEDQWSLRIGVSREFTLRF